MITENAKIISQNLLKISIFDEKGLFKFFCQ